MEIYQQRGPFADGVALLETVAVQSLDVALRATLEANQARRATKKLVAKHMGVSRHSLRCGTHRCTHAWSKG